MIGRVHGIEWIGSRHWFRSDGIFWGAGHVIALGMRRGLATVFGFQIWDTRRWYRGLNDS